MSLPVANFSSIKKYFPHPPRIIPKSIHEPTIIQKPIVSEDVYWRDYYEQSDIAYEWNNGYLEEKPVSDHETCLIYNWFINLLFMFLDTHPIATFSNLEMGFRLSLANNITTVRKPDFGVVLNNNPIPLLDSDRTYHGIFDLCVEALSDSDKQQRERDTITKKAEYAAAGVKEYFILHDSEERAFYRLNAQGVYIPIPPCKGDIVSSVVLSGFQFRTSDLLARPNPEEMLEDPVYQGFIFPTWQLDKHLRFEAEQRAQTSEQRVQTEAALRLEAEQRAQISEQRVQTEAALRVEAEQRAQTEAALRLEVEQRTQNEIARLKALLAM